MPSTDVPADSTTVSGEEIHMGDLALFSASSVPAITSQLVTGLGGAIGSDYRPERHHLIFVEFSGRVSRLRLIPSASVISAGTTTIPGTFLFDFDAGTVSPPGATITPPYDVWWRQLTTTERQLVPVNGAEMVRVGAVSFNQLSYAELMSFAYGTAPIDGSAGAGNQLTEGTVVGVRTPDGNFAKLEVISYGYDLEIRWVTYRPSPAYQVLGTGYVEPEDVRVAGDETTAYVTERAGNLLRVNLASANRASATVVASGMTAPHQLVLDEAHDQAFVVEFAPSGRLLRIDLTTGAQTVLVPGLERAVGLLLTQDLQFAYVSEQTIGADQGRVVRIQLASGHREVLVTGLTAPFFMTWTDPGESGILITERDPANRVTRINLAESPVTANAIVPGTPFRPSSVALVSPTTLLVCCDQEIARYDLTASVYTPTGPMLLGIGHVPADRISRSTPIDAVADGYADTSVDPGYFFLVKDAPFGGTLPIMFNHDRAYDEGARFYKLLVGSGEPRQSWTDFRWSTAANRFLAQAINPSATGYYRVRPPTELWYNHWLGYLLNTHYLTNGLHTVSIRLFASQSGASEIGNTADPGRTLVVRIDNTLPVVAIDEILHDGAVVDTCGIVDSGTDQFTFRITAHDPEEHLQNWRLVTLWGDNRSAVVDADAYAAHASPTKKWAGVSGGIVPMVAPSPWHATVPGDPTSTHCAHTFRLSAWSRVIDGWRQLHRSDYHKAITLMLP